MNLIKKGSLGIISFMCMIVIAGYINYEYNAEREANLGQSVYVISKEGDVINKEVENVSPKEEYLYTAANINFNDMKENVGNLEDELTKIDINDVKISYDFTQNKYIAILPKVLESRNEEILALISNYISLDKVLIKYE